MCRRGGDGGAVRGARMCAVLLRHFLLLLALIAEIDRVTARALGAAEDLVPGLSSLQLLQHAVHVLAQPHVMLKGRK